MNDGYTIWQVFDGNELIAEFSEEVFAYTFLSNYSLANNSQKPNGELATMGLSTRVSTQYPTTIDESFHLTKFVFDYLTKYEAHKSILTDKWTEEKFQAYYAPFLKYLNMETGEWVKK